MDARQILHNGLCLFVILFSIGSVGVQAQPRLGTGALGKMPVARAGASSQFPSGAMGQDLLARVVESAWNGTGWTPSLETFHSYAEGRRTSLETRTWVEATSSWAPELRETYTYGMEGMVQALHESWSPGAGAYEATSRSVYTYSAGSGGTFVLIEEQEDTWNGTAWIPDERWLYSYTGGWAAEIIIQDWDGSAWVNLEREFYEEAGGMLVQVFYEWSGTAWMPRHRTIFPGMWFADMVALSERLAAEADQLVTATRLFLIWPPTVDYGWNGTAWQEETRIRVEKDTQGRTTTVFMDAHDGSAWVIASRYAFEYGPTGMPESARYEIYNEGDGSWMLLSREDYAYDGAGRLLTATGYMVNFMNPTELVPDRLQEFWWTSGGTAREADTDLPSGFVLHPIYPNPFNPSVRVPFDLAQAAWVVMEIYDGAGRLVATLVDGPMPPGRHEVRFDAADAPSGAYQVVLRANGERVSRPVALVR